MAPDYEHENDEFCPECAGPMLELGYRKQMWIACDQGHTIQLTTRDGY